MGIAQPTFRNEWLMIPRFWRQRYAFISHSACTSDFSWDMVRLSMIDVLAERSARLDGFIQRKNDGIMYLEVYIHRLPFRLKSGLKRTNKMNRYYSCLWIFSNRLERILFEKFRTYYLNFFRYNINMKTISEDSILR